LAVAADEFGFVVEEIDGGGGPGHKELHHAAGFWRVVEGEGT
jgi:hypothetical protein